MKFVSRKIGRILLLALFVAVLAASCRNHDFARTPGDLTEDENDTRVGRKIIRCGVPEASQETVDAINNAVQSERTSRAVASRGAGAVVVPVIFHVVASGPSESEGNVSDGALAAQIQALNFAYAGGQGGVPTAFQFSVQGVTRTIDPAGADMTIGSDAERRVKSALRQGGAETLNIYIANPPDGTLGWATFPWDFTSDPAIDGVVLLFQTLPGGSLPPYNEGDTGVHEVGHWLGLFHTFQGACSAENDTIADTPAEQRPAFGCPVGRDSCFGGQPDSIHNFMDYTDDSCLTEFSGEQAARIDQLSQIYRGL